MTLLDFENFIQAQQRELALQEENSAYQKAISDCQQKIQEKVRDADMLQTKLEV